MLQIVTLLSLATLLLWGMSDFLAGRGGRQADPFVTNFVLQLVALIVILPVILFTGLSIDNLGAALTVLATTALLSTAYIFFIRAMARGPMGVAAPIANSYPAVTLLASVAIFGAALKLNTGVALAIIIFGIILLSSSHELLRKNLRYAKTIQLAAVPFIGWGLGFALLNQVVDAFAWYEMLFLLSIGMVVFGSLAMFALTPRSERRIRQIFTRQNRFAMWAGCTQSLGALTLFLAGDIGNSLLIPAVIAAASPLATSVAAFVFDHERLKLVNRFGAVVVVAGIILLNLS